MNLVGRFEMLVKVVKDWKRDIELLFLYMVKTIVSVEVLVDAYRTLADRQCCIFENTRRIESMDSDAHGMWYFPVYYISAV
jgi:hypothetical protein